MSAESLPQATAPPAGLAGNEVTDNTGFGFTVMDVVPMAGMPVQRSVTVTM
jgi:hypothetical protein